MRNVIKIAFLKVIAQQPLFSALACGSLTISGAEKIGYELFESPFFDVKRLIVPLCLLLTAWLTAYFRTSRVSLIALTSLFWGFVLLHVMSLIGVLNVHCNCFPVTGVPQVVVFAFDIFVVIAGVWLLGRWQDFSKYEKIVANVFFVLSLGLVLTTSWIYRNAVEVGAEAVGVDLREVSRRPSTVSSRAGWLIYDVEVEVENSTSRPLLVSLEPTCTCQNVSQGNLQLGALGKVRVGLEHAVSEDVEKRNTDLSLNVEISRSSYNPKEKYRLPVKVINESSR